MSALLALLVPLIIVVLIALIIVWAAERFSPDAFLTKIIKGVTFAVVLIWLLTKLIPLLH